MAAAPKIDDFSDLGELSNVEALIIGDDSIEEEYGVEPISLEDAVSELYDEIGDAVDFMISDIFPNWERAEEFYDGESDVPREHGRSQVSKTTVRDAVRNVKPNMMRVYAQADELVEYTPAEALNYQAATVAMQQTKFANQLFWSSGGYKLLLNSSHNSLLKKVGIMKAYHKEGYEDEYMSLTNLDQNQVESLYQMKDVIVLSVDYDENTTLSEAEVVLRKTSGEICLDHVPLFEFFVDDSATCPEDARVIGQRRDVTVSEAVKMGLEYDDWLDFSAYDVEVTDAGGESDARRGYVKDSDNARASSADVSKHIFLLTEVYAHFDLDGTGVAQLYRFWLGGTEYEYIQHDRVSETPYTVGQINPQPDAFFGKSFYDDLREDQNTGTSLLRATTDNAHASNNVRLAYHETMVNGRDVNSKVLGHPIRFRQPGMLQEVGVSSTVGSMLPLLQYLDQEAQTKAGVTNAAMGLDPDALQSTDKDAVKNTIQLAQGQVELMCRNFAETGLAPLFQKLLRLSLRHNPRQQVIAIDGEYVPVDQYMFTPDMPFKVKVGIGMPDNQSKLQALQGIAAKQEELINSYGPQNPICGLPHLFATMTDMATLMGIPNLGRYFNKVTPEMVQQLSQMMAQKAESQRQEKPSESIIAAENIRAQARIQEQQLENQQKASESDRDTRLKMIEAIMRDDLARDQMAQDLAVDEAKITESTVDKAFVQYEQGIKRDSQMQQFMAKQEAERQKFMQQQQMQMKQQQMQEQMKAQQAQQQPQQPQMPPQGPPQ